MSILLIIGCQHTDETKEENRMIEDFSEVIEEKDYIEVKEDTKKEITVTVGAIGDVLLHKRLYQHAEVDNGRYDFIPMLQGVEDLLQSPDFLMANIESIPGGADIGLSTYPTFNSPQEIVTDLQSLGVDMVIGANNHTLDKGIKAIDSAINLYDEVKMPYVGLYRDTNDRNNARIVTIEDVSLGVLAYTYGTNGIPIPPGHEDVVALFDSARIVDDVQKLRDQVDIVIVHMHWGSEYERKPNQTQRDLAQILSAAGVDIIFGHHPHVLQPIERLKDNDQETIVFYSLGNFYSGQNFDYTDIGGVATVEVTKVIEGDKSSVSLHSPQIEPTLVLHKKNGFFVVPMSEADSPSISGATREDIVEHTQVECGL